VLQHCDGVHQALRGTPSHRSQLATHLAGILAADGLGVGAAAVRDGTVVGAAVALAFDAADVVAAGLVVQATRAIATMLTCETTQ